MSRFDYVKYDKESITAQASIKKEFENVASGVDLTLSAGRAKSLVLTKLEEAYMWCGKAIRDEQIQRNGSAPAQEERSNS